MIDIFNTHHSRLVVTARGLGDACLRGGYRLFPVLSSFLGTISTYHRVILQVFTHLLNRGSDYGRCPSCSISGHLSALILLSLFLYRSQVNLRFCDHFACRFCFCVRSRLRLQNCPGFTRMFPLGVECRS